MKVPSNIKLVNPNIRFCSLEELDDVLLGALEEAAQETPCDFDRALLTGIRVRENVLNFEDKVIEGLLMDFLSKSVTPSRVETVAWFLPAFWSAKSQPDPKLLGLLTEHLSSELAYAELQEALILCLDRAFGLDSDPKLKKRIYVIFQIVSRTSKYEIELPMVVRALDRVLNSTEYT